MCNESGHISKAETSYIVGLYHNFPWSGTDLFLITTKPSQNTNLYRGHKLHYMYHLYCTL